jgi:MFS family permease
MCVIDSTTGAYAYQLFTDKPTAVLCAMPYGILADKIGRKPVLLLAGLGLVLSVLWYDVVCE